MLQRLGHVLGWTGNIIAAVLAIFAGFAFFQGDQQVVGWLLAGAAVVAFLIGRALRYIFAGPSPGTR